MSSNVNSVQNVIKVALGLCVICSIMISSAAVLLKPRQTANQLLDRNKNVLIAAGMFNPDVDANADVEARFSEFNARMVDLQEGRFLTEEEMQSLGVDPQSYDQQSAKNDPEMSINLIGDQDVASIRRRANYATVYTLTNDSGEIESIVLTVA